MGNILQDSVGQNAKKKIAKRRIDFITANISSYSRSLNNASTLDHIADTNKLASCLATISAAKDAVKDATKKKKEADEKEKSARKEKDKADYEAKRVEACAILAEDIGKGLGHLCSLSVNKMKMLLKYYFEVPTGLSKLRRDELQALIESSFIDQGKEQCDDFSQQNAKVDHGMVEQGNDECGSTNIVQEGV